MAMPSDVIAPASGQPDPTTTAEAAELAAEAKRDVVLTDGATMAQAYLADNPGPMLPTGMHPRPLGR